MSGLGRRSLNHPRYHRPIDPEADDRETDPGLFLELDSRYRFTVDAAASYHNAKLPRYWTVAVDGLRQPWRGERVWCNPPFSRLAPWIEKAWDSQQDGCELAVLLLPANRSDQPFWQRLIEPFRDREPRAGRGWLRSSFLPGRPRFAYKGAWGGRPAFGLVLLEWSAIDPAGRPLSPWSGLP